VALLAANLIASRLEDHYTVLFRAPAAGSAHECILDLRPLKRSADWRLMTWQRLMGLRLPCTDRELAGWPATGDVEPTESGVRSRKIESGSARDGRIRARRPPLNRALPIPATTPLRAPPHPADRPLPISGIGPTAASQRPSRPAVCPRHTSFWRPWPDPINAYGDRTLGPAPVRRWRKTGGQRVSIIQSILQPER